MDEKIRILIVDDHTVVRSGLRLFLLAFPDLEVVGEAGNGRQAIEMCGVCAPDVVIMDLVMPEMNGIETTRQIRAKFPKTHVVALTSFPDEHLVQDAIAAGATGYLLKTASAPELVEAIRASAQGKAIYAREVEQALVKHPEERYYPEALTHREKQVLHCIVQGKSNAEIAEEMVVGVSTIKYHVSHILAKLGVKSRSEAIAYAVQHRMD
jgi:two-component system, NarL family, response regulator LiaR